MKFNIMGFNQETLVNKYSNLNGNDLIVLRTMVDVLPRMTRTIEVEGKEFKQVTYELLLEDVPFVTQSVSTLKKIVQKFIDNNLIERYILNKGGKFTFFRTTEDLENLIYKEEVEEVKPAKKKKSSSKKKKVVETPIEVLEGQISIDEVPEETEQVKVVNEVITTGKISEELKEVVNSKSIEEVVEVIEKVKSNNNGSINNTYILNAFNRQVKTVKESNDNIDKLESALLGYSDFESDDELSMILSNRNSNYTNNNKKRLA